MPRIVVCVQLLLLVSITTHSLPLTSCRCFDCILNQESCGLCVHAASLYGTGEPDVGACLGCVQRQGDKYIGGCNACAQSFTPQRCFDCLSSFPLKFCNKTSYNKYAGCYLTTDQTPCDICANAAKSSEVFDTCLSCYIESNATGECAGCLIVPVKAADQEKCFKCVQQAGFPSYDYYGCSQCFSQWIMPGRTDMCVSCAASRSTPLPNKAKCAFCLDQALPDTSVPSQQQCLDCLQTTVTEQDDNAKKCPGDLNQ